MTEQQLIKAAIKGECPLFKDMVLISANGSEVVFKTSDGTVKFNFHSLLLNPRVWQAAGKCLGWSDKYSTIKPTWIVNMHAMIDALADGQSISEYIRSL